MKLLTDDPQDEAVLGAHVGHDGLHTKKERKNGRCEYVYGMVLRVGWRIEQDRGFVIEYLESTYPPAI